MVFRGPNGMSAGVGAQHSQCFAAWFASVPGLKVLNRRIRLSIPGPRWLGGPVSWLVPVLRSVVFTPVACCARKHRHR